MLKPPPSPPAAPLPPLPRRPGRWRTSNICLKLDFHGGGLFSQEGTATYSVCEALRSLANPESQFSPRPPAPSARAAHSRRRRTRSPGSKAKSERAKENEFWRLRVDSWSRIWPRLWGFQDVQGLGSVSAVLHLERQLRKNLLFVICSAYKHANTPRCLINHLSRWL